MHFMHLNLAAIVVAAIATMIVGFLWYSPFLFAKPWMIAMGYNPDDKEALAKMAKSAGKLYSLSFVASLIAAGVLAKLLDATGLPDPIMFGVGADVLYAVKLALVVWFGFVMTVQLTNTLFGMKPFKLFLIDTGYQLVCYVVMGAILGAWR